MPNVPSASRLLLSVSLLAASAGCYQDTTHAVVRSPAEVAVWLPTEGETRLLVPASSKPETARVDPASPERADLEWGSVLRAEDGSLETSAIEIGPTRSTVLVGRDGQIDLEDWGTHALDGSPSHARLEGGQWVFDVHVRSTAEQRCGKHGYCAKYRYPLQLTTPAANVVEVRTHREYDRPLGLASILLGAAPTIGGIALIDDTAKTSPTCVAMGILTLAIGLAMEVGGVATVTLPDSNVQ